MSAPGKPTVLHIGVDGTTYAIETLLPAKAPLDVRDAAGRLDGVIDAAGRAGVVLDDGFLEARAQLDRVRDVQHRFNRDKPDLEVEAGRIARALVAGEIDFDEAARDAVLIEARASGLLERAVARSDRAALSLAWSSARTSLDGDRVLDDARRVVTDAVDEVRGLRDALGSARDADAATRKGPKAAAAWSSYVAALERWEAAHDLVGLARVEGWIAPLPVPAVEDRRTEHRHLFAKRVRGRLAVRRFVSQGKMRVAEVDGQTSGTPFAVLLDEATDRAVPIPPPTIEEEITFLREQALSEDRQAVAALEARRDSGKQYMAALG